VQDDARIAAAFDRFYEAFRRLTPREELSLTAASTLRRLERSGPQRLSELKEGLAARGGDPADGRVVVVRITDAGRAAVARRRDGRARALSEVLQRLAPEDRAALVAAVPALERLSDLIIDGS
jgi:DNA-binding MarR family transcriptional regulator